MTASFVPPPPIRALRDMTRARTHITRERSREVQRLEKLLEDAGIKLSSVATDITGVSGRAMLEALIAGQTDPAVIADLAKRTLRRKIPALTEALIGRFSAHHAFMVRLFLDRIDAHTADIGRLDERIEEAMAPFRLARELLMSIPGFSSKTAEVFIAETGGDMTVFPTRGIWLPGQASHRDPTNPRAGSSPPGHVRATRISKARSGFRGCRRHGRRTRSSPPSTNGSDPGAGRCAPSSPSNTPWSSPRGTCSVMEPSTANSEPTATASANRPKPKPAP